MTSPQDEIESGHGPDDEARTGDLRVPRLFLERGRAWAQRGKLDEALADFDETLRHISTNPEIYVDRAINRIRVREFESALADLDEAHRLDPENTRILFYRAAAAFLLARDGAASDAEAGLKLGGWRHPLAPHLAILGAFDYRRMGRLTGARQLIDRALQECDPDVWPFPVVRYLGREIDREALFATIEDEEYDVAEEVWAYTGLDEALDGRREEALEHLQWVKEHGDPTCIEFDLAVAELGRLEEASSRPFAGDPR